MRSYSGVNAMQGLSSTCFWGIAGISRNEAQIPHIPVCSTPNFTYQTKSYLNVNAIWVLPVLVYLGHYSKLGKLCPLPQIMGMDTQKVVQSVKLHISHQMKPYSSVKAIWRLSYTCASVFGHSGKSGKLGPNTPNYEHQYIDSHSKC